MKTCLRSCWFVMLSVMTILSFAHLVAAQPSSVPVAPPPGIISWWSFDETSGNQAADRLGKSPGAYVNNPIPAPGLVRGSLRFNGTNYVSVPQNSLWSFGSKDFSFEFWVNFDTPQGGSIGHPSSIFVGCDEGPNNRNKYFFALGGGYLEFHINGPGIGPKFFPLVPFNPSVARWYHLAIVRSGYSYTIFINGVPAGTAMDSDVIPTPNAPLTIAQSELIGFLQGRMDELTIYNRALSNAEVQAIYNAGSAGKGIPLAVYPNHGGDTGQVTVLIEGGTGLNGSTFSPGVTAALKRSGQPDIIASPVTIAPDGSSLHATFNLAGQSDGLWDVVTTNAGASTTIPGGFAVEPGRATHVWADVVGPNFIAFGRPAVYTLAVSNDGNVDALGIPVIVLGIPNDWSLQPGFEITLPPQVTAPNPIDWSKVPFVSSTAQGQSVPLLISRVAPGAPVLLNLPVVPPRHSEQVTVSAVVGEPLIQNPPIPPTPGPSSECLSELNGFALDFLERSLPSNCFTSLVQWEFSAADIAIQYLLNGKNDVMSYTQLLVGGLETGFECAGIAFPELTIVLDAVDAGIDLIKVLDACYAKADNPKPVNVVGSVDPNDLFGPTGVGNAGWVNSLRPLYYTISFGNKSSATAPAQEVIVTDHLDPSTMNLGSVSFGLIGFGSTLVNPPTGTNTFVSNVDLRPAQNLIVRIVANVDPNSGVATWHFTSLDPATGTLPTDPTIGFLPPGGEGNIQFSIMPKSGLSTGTFINNSAGIVFDLNSPINTASWTNAIDSTPPVSQVNSLVAVQGSTSFPVTWQGTDVGSGVQDFTIYVSDNGGPYMAWLTNRNSTQASFNGQPGHTYAFYSTARDNVFNVEAAHTKPDATTTVTSVMDVSSQVSIIRGGYSYNRSLGRFVQTVTLKNTGSSAISGPVSLVLDSLSANATLANQSGVTSVVTPAGSPYINVTLGGGLAPGVSASVVLQFADPKMAAITYNTRVLSGVGSR